MNAITSKKMRLSREKEALDVSENSALFLHPNQFTLTNPASPGGTHSKRTTRLRREMDESHGYSDNKKRKRNGADEDGSPGPMRRALDGSSTTPLWQSDRLRSGAARKETGPIFSIDKLFTDKELSMNYNSAAVAAYKHLLTRRDAAGNVLSPDGSDAGNGDLNGIEKDEELSAPTMERQPSHQTRSTRTMNNHHNWYDDKIIGAEGLANFELPGNLEKMDALEPKLPPLIHSQYSKAYVKSESNTPSSLSLDDAAQDMTIMNVFKSYERTHGAGANIEVANGGRRLLENMVLPQRSGRPFAAIIQGARPPVDNVADSLGVSGSSLRDEPGMGPNILGNLAPGVSSGNHHSSPAAPPMSRQSSFGGVAMSRSGSGRGKRRG